MTWVQSWLQLLMGLGTLLALSCELPELANLGMGNCSPGPKCLVTY